MSSVFYGAEPSPGRGSYVLSSFSIRSPAAEQPITHPPRIHKAQSLPNPRSLLAPPSQTDARNSITTRQPQSDPKDLLTIETQKCGPFTNIIVPELNVKESEETLDDLQSLHLSKSPGKNTTSDAYRH